MTSMPSLAMVRWPRSTPSATLRPLARSDADVMWSYRSRPDVCRYLSHPPLTYEDVRLRLEGLLSGRGTSSGSVVQGIAVIVESLMVGDGLLRVQHARSGPPAWIAYALHPQVWGRGVGTEVALELRAAAEGSEVPVWAETFAENVASQRVLQKAGFIGVGEVTDGDRVRYLYTSQPESAAQH